MIRKKQTRGAETASTNERELRSGLLSIKISMDEETNARMFDPENDAFNQSIEHDEVLRNGGSVGQALGKALDRGGHDAECTPEEARERFWDEYVATLFDRLSVDRVPSKDTKRGRGFLRAAGLSSFVDRSGHTVYEGEGVDGFLAAQTIRASVKLLEKERVHREETTHSSGLYKDDNNGAGQIPLDLPYPEVDRKASELYGGVKELDADVIQFDKRREQHNDAEREQYESRLVAARQVRVREKKMLKHKLAKVLGLLDGLSVPVESTVAPPQYQTTEHSPIKMRYFAERDAKGHVASHLHEYVANAVKMARAEGVDINTDKYDNQ